MIKNGTILLFLLSTFVFAQKNKKEFPIEISEFTELICKGNFTVFLKQDSMSSLKIISTKKGIKDIKTTINGRKLEIIDLNKTDIPTEVFLNYRKINSIQLAGKVELKNDLICAFDSLEIKTSGNTRCTINVLSKKINITSKTKSKNFIEGEIETLNVHCFSNSYFNLDKSIVLKSTINLHDYSKATVNTNQALYGNLGSFTELEVKGFPKPLDLFQEKGSLLNTLDTLLIK